MNQIDKLLENYAPGDPSNKPDVLKQIKEIEAERAKMIEEHQRNNANGKIILNQNGNNIELNNQQIVQLLQQQQEKLQELTKILHEKDMIIQKLQNDLQNNVNMNNKINKLIDYFEKDKKLELS